MHAPSACSSSELLKKVCQDKTRYIYQQDYVPPVQGSIVNAVFSYLIKWIFFLLYISKLTEHLKNYLWSTVFHGMQRTCKF